MEFFIAIMIYLGILSPDASATMNQAEFDYLMQCNQDAIHQVLQNPEKTQAVNNDFIIDRRED